MLQELLSALGGSIIYEEYKGDFVKARRIADVWLSEARQSGEPGGISDAFLWSGVVHLLGGNPIEATNAFTLAKCSAGQDAERCLFIESFQWLACLDRYYTTPDGSSLLSADLSKRFALVKCWNDATQRWNEIRNLVTDQSILDTATFVFQQLHNVRLYRGIVDSAATSSLDIPFDNFAKPFADEARKRAEAGHSSMAGYLTYIVGDMYRRGHYSQKAEQILREAIGYYRSKGDCAGEAVCWMAIGDCYCAPNTTPMAWNFRWSERLGDPTDTTLRASPVWPDTKALECARECFRQAEKLFGISSAPRGLAQIRLRDGYLATVTRDFQVALRCAEEASARFQTCGDQRGWAVAQTHVTMSCIALRGVGGATEAIARWGDNSGSFAFTLCLGFLLSDGGCQWLNWKGDYERALTTFKAARTLYETLHADINTASAVADIGFTYNAVGDRATAANYLEDAARRYAEEDLSSMRDGKTVGQIMNLMMGLYNIYLARMDSDGMERSLELLRRLCKHATHMDPIDGIHVGTTFSAALGATTGSLLPTSLTFAPVNHDLPHAHKTRDDDTASDHFRTLVHDFLPSHVREQYAVTSVLSPLYRARLEKESGNDLAADQLVKQALASARKAGQKRYLLEALLLADEKRYEEAAAIYKQYVSAATGQHMPVLPHTSSATILQRQAVINLHKQAFSMLLRLKDYDAAREHLQTITSAEGEEWYSKSERPWLELSDCGELQEGLGNYPEALRCYDLAIEAFEARRTQLFRDELKTALADDKGVQLLYLQAARAYSKSGQPFMGFHYCEKGKARALLDLMASVLAIKGDVVENDMFRSWRERSAHLQLLQGLLDAERNRAEFDEKRVAELREKQILVELELNQTETELSAEQPDFFSAVNRNAQAMTVEQVANSLQKDSLLLEYFMAGDDFLSWAIDGSGGRRSFHTGVDGMKVRRLIGDFHRACSSQNRIEQLGGDLSALFLAPFADAIRSANEVIVVPYGLAHKVPFAALPFDGLPLIEQCPICYLPSASTLQFLHGRHDSHHADDAIVVGNPTGDLLYAEQEAEFIAALLGTKPLTRGDAAKAALRRRLGKASIVHLATHGRVVAEAPLASSIVLADGEELTLYEMMGLRLRSDLVVLSACDTALGKNTGGDELFGFARALLATGARSAIVSLWPINDLSTNILMGKFYAGVDMSVSGQPSRGGGAGAISALQRAQLWLRHATAAEMALADRWDAVYETTSDATLKKQAWWAKKHYGKHPREKPFSAPYHWAGFTYIGL